MKQSNLSPQRARTTRLSDVKHAVNRISDWTGEGVYAKIVSRHIFRPAIILNSLADGHVTGGNHSILNSLRQASNIPTR
jgi:hypothetical protein